MATKKYKAIIRRIEINRLKGWLKALKDMYEWGRVPVLGLIIDMKREIEERESR